jgi:hypothetical protein
MLLNLAVFALVAQSAICGKPAPSPTSNAVDARVETAGATKSCKAQGLKKCDGVCVDINTDPNHCGSCRHACSSGQVCRFGACFTKGPRKCKNTSSCDKFISCGNFPSSSCGCVSDYNTGALSCVEIGGICTACQFNTDCTAGSGGVCIRVASMLPLH